MDKQEVVDFLSHTLNISDPEGLRAIYRLVDSNVIDSPKIRNALILKEFDEKLKKGVQNSTSIKDDIAFKYNLSIGSIKRVISMRRSYIIK